MKIICRKRFRYLILAVFNEFLKIRNISFIQLISYLYTEDRKLNSFPELTKQTTQPNSQYIQHTPPGPVRCAEQYLLFFLITRHPLIIRHDPLCITRVNVDKDEKVFVQDYLD